MPVNSHHSDYEKFFKKWKRCCDVYDGEDAIHEAGPEYLPKLKDQSQEDYEAYKLRTPFYNATYRTIVGLVGMMFRRSPKMEVPPVIQEMVDTDITLSGKPLKIFAQQISTESLKVGRVGILVDTPTVQVPDGIQPTLADQRLQNVRPSMAMYVAQSIINWKTDKVNNSVVLSMVVLKECEEIPKDEYTSEKKDIYRVLDLSQREYRVRKYRRKERTAGQPSPSTSSRTPQEDSDYEQIGSDLFPIMGGKRLDFIPFVFIGAEDLETDATDPPLIDLVNTNLSHYRTRADYEHGAHFTGLPTPWVAGHTQENKNEKMYVGSSHAWVFASEKTRVGYLEFGGQGLGTLKNILDEKETQMAILGARMLEPQKKQAETAESKEIHRKGEESMLAMISNTVSMGIQRALSWFADWAGGDGSTCVYAQNTDFFPAPMDPGMLTAQVSTWQMGGISDQTLFENLKRGEIIPEDRTYEEEQALIEAGAQRMSALNALTQPEPPSSDGEDPNADPTHPGGTPDGLV
jgi:hypothetical protein